MRKPEKTVRRCREDWRVLVREWKASGTTAKEFSRARGLSMTALFYWSSTLKSETLARAAPRLLPVVVTGPVGARSAELELVVGPMMLRFDDGASPTYVAELARALLVAAST
jgi:hypothetical protein